MLWSRWVLARLEVTVAGWIAETEAEKARHEVNIRHVTRTRERMTEREIRSIVQPCYGFFESVRGGT